MNSSMQKLRRSEDEGQEGVTVLGSSEDVEVLEEVPFAFRPQQSSALHVWMTVHRA